jgi:hypothetical protein
MPLGYPTFLNPRVEIRKCNFEGSIGGFIQLAAWSKGARTPSLLLETDQISLGQVVMSGRVAVIETTGETANRIFVIVFENWIPKLALKRITKGALNIHSSTKKVIIEIEGPGGRLESHAFSAASP